MTDAPMPASLQTGLYLHWPFCAKLCPYCDFNIYKNRGELDAALLEALCEDIRYWGHHLKQRPLTSIYFGGGTPSLMAPQSVAKIIDLCADEFSLQSDCEITLEANPTDAETEKLSRFRNAGINRLSLGVQSFDDAALKFLGRNHDSKTAKYAIEKTLQLFPKSSFDLIYALPTQTEEQWQQELETAIAFGSAHLSLYQLTVEPGTAFDKQAARGDWHPLPDDREADLYIQALEICADAGLNAYEVSNLATQGHESAHNKLYWQSQDWIGIGPGGHGRVTLEGQRYATETILKPRAYCETAVERRFTYEALSPQDQATEYLSMGLRLQSGISLARYQEIAEAPLKPSTLDTLVSDRLAIIAEDHFALTTQGRLLLNKIVLDLISSPE